MNDTQSAKRFHVSDLLSVTTGKLLSTTHMEGVSGVLSHLTGQSLFTHQLGKAVDVSTPYLLEQFPWLDSLNPADGADVPELMRWLGKVAAEHGEWHDVQPMPREVWGDPDPIADLVAMVGADRVIPVVVEP